MHLIYRRFDTAEGTVTLEHDCLDRSDQTTKNIFTNPRKPLSNVIDTLRTSKVDILILANEDVLKQEVISEIESLPISKGEIKPYLENINTVIDKEGFNFTPKSFFEAFDFETEIMSHITCEFLFFEQETFLYYRITNNTTWMSFLNKDPKYIVKCSCIRPVNVDPVESIVESIVELNHEDTTE